MTPWAPTQEEHLGLLRAIVCKAAVNVEHTLPLGEAAGTTSVELGHGSPPPQPGGDGAHAMRQQDAKHCI
jgi:hypothetical protein